MVIESSSDSAKFSQPEPSSNFATDAGFMGGMRPITEPLHGATDHWLPKLDVEGSSPFARSESCQISREPNAVYHQRPELSTSQIKDFVDDPLAFCGRHIERTAPPRKSTALDYGTQVHLRAEIGEDAWHQRKRVAALDCLTAAGSLNKAGEAWFTEVSADPNAIPLTPSVSEQIDAQFAGIYRNPKARELLDGTIDREFSVAWNWDGYPVRCRPDGVTKHLWYDLKTCRQPQPLKDWWKSVVDYKYAYQAAIYGEGAVRCGWPPHDMVFIVTSTTWPHACHCVTLPPAMVVQARFEVLRALAEISQRIQFDTWTPDDYGHVQELPCPNYLKEFRYGR